MDLLPVIIAVIAVGGGVWWDSSQPNGVLAQYEPWAAIIIVALLIGGVLLYLYQVRPRRP